MRKHVSKEEGRAAKDCAAFLKEQEMLKMLSVCNDTTIDWHSSKAKQLLKDNIDNNKHKQMTPKQLYNTQDKYKRFSLKTFCGQIHQEVKCCKFLKQYKSK